MKNLRNNNSPSVRAFKENVHAWAAKIRVKPRQIRVQKMRRKWASCSTAGWVTFSEELLDEPQAFRDYVIVHELLHLKVPNHGKLFKSLIRVHLPNHRPLNLAPAHILFRNRTSVL